MKEKVYRIATCYGTLTTVSGEKYILLAPLPVPPDSWQLDHQQGWSVVPYSTEDGMGIDFNFADAYAQPRVIITSFPTINPQLGEIWVWSGEYRDEEEQIEVNDEPTQEDQEWYQMEMFPGLEVSND